MNFDEFMLSELPRLSRFAGALTGDRDLSHDLVLDALDNVRRKWRRVSRMDDPAAYVIRVVVTNYLDHTRRDRRRRDIADRAPTAITPGDDCYQRWEDLDLLGRSLTQLSKQYRTALVLRYYLDMSTAQVATQMNLTPGSARSCISRALAQIRVVAIDQPQPQTRETP